LASFHLYTCANADAQMARAAAANTAETSRRGMTISGCAAFALGRVLDSTTRGPEQAGCVTPMDYTCRQARLPASAHDRSDATATAFLAPPPRHLPAAQPVHHRRDVRWLLRDRGRDRGALHRRRDRGIHRGAAGRHGRAHRAPDEDAERIRGAIRLAFGPGQLRPCAGARAVYVVAAVPALLRR